MSEDTTGKYTKSYVNNEYIKMWLQGKITSKDLESRMYLICNGEGSVCLRKELEK